MALQICPLNMNAHKQELHPHGESGFPCAGYQSYHTQAQEDEIPWHWHEDLEIISIIEGQLEIRIPERTFFMKKGDLLFINGGIPHFGVGAKAGRLSSFVFSSRLITGENDSIFSKKYMNPLLASSQFAAHYFPQEQV